jgi:hypothetical protein
VGFPNAKLYRDLPCRASYKRLAKLHFGGEPNGGADDQLQIHLRLLCGLPTNPAMLESSSAIHHVLSTSLRSSN